MGSQTQFTDLSLEVEDLNLCHFARDFLMIEGFFGTPVAEALLDAALVV